MTPNLTNWDWHYTLDFSPTHKHTHRQCYMQHL